MKLENKDIEAFIDNYKYMEIKLSLYTLTNETVYNLYSKKMNVVVDISDSDDNYAVDKSLYIDYVYLDDGMKAWQIQMNSSFLEERGVKKLKELLPKFFNGEKIIIDNDLIKPLRNGCNFSKTNSNL